MNGVCNGLIFCNQCRELLFDTRQGAVLYGRVDIEVQSFVDDDGIATIYSQELQAVVHKCRRRDGEIEADMGEITNG